MREETASFEDREDCGGGKGHRSGRDWPEWFRKKSILKCFKVQSLADVAVLLVDCETKQPNEGEALTYISSSKWKYSSTVNAEYGHEPGERLRCREMTS